MANLIYVANTSLDGYTEDKDGKFDWTDSGEEEVFRYVTDIDGQRTHLYGRRMYESMRVWETDPALAEGSPLRRDFAEVWQTANKIVYSSTLETIPTRKTQLERAFEPEAIRQLKEAVEHDILIGGPELAAHAFRAGLIDECHLFVIPLIVGGGKSALPDNVRLKLALLAERRFDNGTVFLRYRIKPGSAT
ncbi:MAG: dihydrofolate reductase family protein [Caldilineaceae bacterium]